MTAHEFRKPLPARIWIFSVDVRHGQKGAVLLLLFVTWRFCHIRQIFLHKAKHLEQRLTKAAKVGPFGQQRSREAAEDPLLCSLVLYQWHSVSDREALPCRHEIEQEDNVAQRIIFVYPHTVSSHCAQRFTFLRVQRRPATMVSGGRTTGTTAPSSIFNVSVFC